MLLLLLLTVSNGSNEWLIHFLDGVSVSEELKEPVRNRWWWWWNDGEIVSVYVHKHKCEIGNKFSYLSFVCTSKNPSFSSGLICSSCFIWTLELSSWCLQRWTVLHLSSVSDLESGHFQTVGLPSPLVLNVNMCVCFVCFGVFVSWYSLWRSWDSWRSLSTVMSGGGGG